MRMSSGLLIAALLLGLVACKPGANQVANTDPSPSPTPSQAPTAPPVSGGVGN